MTRATEPITVRSLLRQRWNAHQHGQEAAWRTRLRFQSRSRSLQKLRKRRGR